MIPGLCHGLRRAVQLRGSGVAVIDGDRRFTWRDINGRIAALARGFRDRGVGAGERVALLALNSHRSFETYFAALYAGGVIVPLNHRLATREVIAQVVDAQPVLLVLGAEFAALAEDIRASCPSIRAVILAAPEVDADPAPGRPDALDSYEAIIALADPLPDAERADADLACLFYTGGTTGEAKGVMLSHRNIMANSLNFIAHLGMDEHCVHLHCGPLFHVAAGVRLFSVTLAGGTHVILPRFEPRSVLETIARERITIATFVPTMLRALLDQPDLDDFDLSGLRYITYGAAAMPEAMLREALTRLPWIRFVQSYGMTETSPIVTMLGWREHMLDGEGRGARLRSAGRPALLADVGIADADGRFQPPGTRGEVMIRGPMVMEGYWRRPEATSAAMCGDWLRSGDVGYIDDDGYLFIVDRLKDVIITGGENVYSQDVENAILTHPDVLECAVLGIADSQWGEAVHAVIVPRPGAAALTPETVLRHCKGLLAGFKCPKSITIREERLPLSGANKILKTQLRAELLAGSPAHEDATHAR